MQDKKSWRVVKYDPAANRYVIDYFKNGVRQCTFQGTRDDKKGIFYLRLQVRYPYREVSAKRAVYFEECTWEI